MSSPRRRRPATKVPGSQLGPTGLLIIGVVVVFYLIDQQFGWGLFPSDNQTPIAQVTQGATVTPGAGGVTGGNGVPTGLPTTAEAATVVSVADGDTITVELNGERASVRLIGIDTPETFVTRTGYKECYGAEASAFAKGALTPGTVVYLDRDITDSDRYDRLLRYVWVDAGSIGAGAAGTATMFNELLVRDGFAIPYPYAPDNREQPRFEAAAAAAESTNLGIWCSCGGERIPLDETNTSCPAPAAAAWLPELAA